MNPAIRSDWYKGLIYQFRPQAHQEIRDGEHIGYGTIRGLMDDHTIQWLKSLNVTGVYLNPLFPVYPLDATQHPQTSDEHYEPLNLHEIDPRFGTIQDLKKMCALYAQHGMVVICDLVFALSDESDFFKASVNKDHPLNKIYDNNWEENIRNDSWYFKDWFTWADPLLDGNSPNNWSRFPDANGNCASGWQYYSERGQYCLAMFMEKQRNLNIDCVYVRDYIKYVVDLYVREIGIRGIRIDEPAQPGITRDFYNPEYTNLQVYSSGTEKLPPGVINNDNIIELVSEIAAIAHEHNAIIVPELATAGGNDPYEEWMRYHDEGNSDAAIAFLTQRLGICRNPKSSVFRSILMTVLDYHKSFVYFGTLETHDTDRVLYRFVDENLPENLRQLAASQVFDIAICAIPGSFVLYHGSEKNLDGAIIPPDKARDDNKILSAPRTRDVARASRYFDPGLPNGGFSKAAEDQLYMPVDYQEGKSDLEQRHNPYSSYNRLRLITELFSGNAAFWGSDGRIIEIEEDVLAVIRLSEDEQCQIACIYNLSHDKKEISLREIIDSPLEKSFQILYSHIGSEIVINEEIQEITLPPRGEIYLDVSEMPAHSLHEQQMIACAFLTHADGMNLR